MLIYITNRKITNFQTGSPTQLADIGRDLKDESDSVKVGIYNNNAIQFYADGNYNGLFGSIHQEALLWAKRFSTS